MAPHSPYSPARTIATTATREIQVLARTKSVWVTIILLIVAILGTIGFIAWQTNKDDADSPTPLAAVGVPASAFEGSGFDARETPDRAEAERLVRDGDVDTAVVASPNGWEVLAKGGPSISTLSEVGAIATRYAGAQALSELGISPEQYAAVMPNTQVTGTDISDDGEHSEADMVNLLTTLIGLFVIMFTVILFAANIGSRVTAEKSSRVVELVLAAVRPMDFLAGKILGNVAFGFAATAAILGSGVAGMAASGFARDFDVPWGILAGLVASWLLAMAFFGALYAAAGSMVQRTEDLQSTQAPILFLLMAAVYVPMFGWSHTSATWMQVMSWVPPFSIFTAPITYAGGDMSLAQLCGSYAIALVATVAAVWLAARIYRGSILNNGRKLTWVEAVRA